MGGPCITPTHLLTLLTCSWGSATLHALDGVNPLDCSLLVQVGLGAPHMSHCLSDVQWVGCASIAKGSTLQVTALHVLLLESFSAPYLT